MEAKLKCRACKKGTLFPTSTTIYHCYNCQRAIPSHPNGGARITCSGCEGELIVPTNITAYRCSFCDTLTNPISSHAQPTQDTQTHSPRKKIGSILFKRDQSQRNERSAPSTTGSSSSLALSGTPRYNKRAVLCGVTYNKKALLKGPINDVLDMKQILVKIFDFPIEGIRILTEKEKNPNFVPTKKNILESLEWLVKDCQPGDSLFFYFSGHGSRRPDSKEDELDGFNEAICPADFLREGVIIDNDLNSIIVRPLKKDVTLLAIVDACHSGTILDLKYVYNLENIRWDDNSPPAKEPMIKDTSGGLAICISACEDNQIAVDTKPFRRRGMQGAMTYLLVKTIKENPEITYGEILTKIHEELEMIKQKPCRPRWMQLFFQNKIEQLQDPMISSSEVFDIFTRKFVL